MIHKLPLRNFKGIELQALDLLSAIARPNTTRHDILGRYGGRPVVTRSGTTDLLVEASGRWEQKSGTLGIMLNAAAPNELKIHGQREGQPFEIEDKTPSRTPFGRLIHPQPELQQESPVFLRSFLEHWETHVFLRLDSRNLAEPSYTESVDPRIDTSGAGLASMLAQMALNRPDDFAKLRDALRAVIPSVVRVRLSLAEVKRQESETIRINDEAITRHVSRTYSGHRVLFDTQSGTGIPSEAASEGTLLVLGLLAALMASPRPKLVLLDDLDRGLHPKAQQDLVAQLRDLREVRERLVPVWTE